MSKVEKGSPEPNNIKTNGKWAWEDNGQPREEDYLPEDWCCISESPIPTKGGRNADNSGSVFPKYVNWGQPNHKSLYQRDFLWPPKAKPTKKASANPYSSFSTNEPMELTTSNRVFIALWAT